MFHFPQGTSWAAAIRERVTSVEVSEDSQVQRRRERWLMIQEHLLVIDNELPKAQSKDLDQTEGSTEHHAGEASDAG